jgi:hypothetical protein
MIHARNFKCPATGLNCVEPDCRRGYCISEQSNARHVTNLATTAGDEREKRLPDLVGQVELAIRRSENRTNKDVLAEAICRVLVRHGKKTQEEIENGHRATIRRRLDDDIDYFRMARSHGEVRAIYVQIVSRTCDEPVP